jgi:hypothetical protein
LFPICSRRVCNMHSLSCSPINPSQTESSRIYIYACIKRDKTLIMTNSLVPRPYSKNVLCAQEYFRHKFDVILTVHRR